MEFAMEHLGYLGKGLGGMAIAAILIVAFLEFVRRRD